MMPRNRGHDGFTLLEVVITLSIIAILSSAMFVFFNNALTRGHLPLKRMTQTAELHTVMENITARYDEFDNDAPANSLHSELGGSNTPHGLPTAFSAGIQGEIAVTENNFIGFGVDRQEGQPAEAGPTMLKVTIRNGQGESLTAIFSN